MPTWNERLDEPASSEVRPVGEGRKNLRAGQLMLLPNGRTIATMIQSIPPGQTMTVKSLRSELATQFGADITCPVTTGHCLRIVAEAAYESFIGGVPISEVTPIWRVLDERAPTLKKVSFDPSFVLDQRAQERHDHTESGSVAPGR